MITGAKMIKENDRNNVSTMPEDLKIQGITVPAQIQTLENSSHTGMFDADQR